MIEVLLAGRVGPDFTVDFAFKVPAQGVTALLGPSGSGKTTLLRSLAGLEHLAGAIVVSGTVWQDAKTFVPPERRHVGYVFQGVGLLPHLSVRANLAYATKRAGAGPFDPGDIIGRTGMAPLLDRMPGRLSGGEAQRAAMARALLSQPRLLLLDEPLSGLDSDARDALLGELEELLAAIPIPVIYVTHDATEARRLASQTVRLRGGRVEAIEPS